MAARFFARIGGRCLRCDHFARFDSRFLFSETDAPKTLGNRGPAPGRTN